jgi:broad specificity phosphatase PhoE
MLSVPSAVTPSMASVRHGGPLRAMGNAVTRAASQLAIHRSGETPAVQALRAGPSEGPIVVLFRHGETPDNCPKGTQYQMPDGSWHTSLGKKYSGRNDVGLNTTGWRQARDGGRVAAQHPLLQGRLHDALYVCSPQRRVQETFQGFLEGAGLVGANVQKVDDRRLEERSAGPFTNMTWDEGAEKWSELGKGKEASVFKKAAASYPSGVAQNNTWYPGESAVDAGNRGCPAADEYLRTGSQVIFLFTHEMVVKPLLQHLLQNCRNHVKRPCTTNAVFKHEARNAEPIILMRRGNRMVRVDDGAPASESSGARRLAKKFERVFQAIGRSRLY